MRRVVAIALLGIVACGSQQGDVARDAAEGVTNDGTPLVARVGMHEIRRGDVERRMRAHRLDARSALRELEDEALLFDEATRRGYESALPISSATTRIAVQRLLRDAVEAQVPLAQVTDEAVHAHYVQHRDVFVHPEMRSSAHLLVRLGLDASADEVDAGRAIATRAIEEMLAGEPRDVLARYEGLGREGGLSLVVEEVPPLSRSSAAAAPYLAALYSVAGPVPEVIATPVRTEYGWHAIVVTGVRAAESRTEGEAATDIRRELVVPLRERRLAELVRELTHRFAIVRDEDAIARALLSESSAGRTP